MGEEFFVSFNTATGEQELLNIVYKMNSINSAYRTKGSEETHENVLSIVHGVLGERKGFFVKKLDSECYGILWRKYFSLSHNDGEVFFYDEEYEHKKLATESEKAGAVKIAFA